MGGVASLSVAIRCGRRFGFVAPHCSAWGEDLVGGELIPRVGDRDAESPLQGLDARPQTVVIVRSDDGLDETAVEELRGDDGR